MLGWEKFAAILSGSFLIASGIDFFLVPFRVLDGGIIGISLILNYLFGFRIGLTVILCSVPIFVIAWRSYRDYFYNSLHGMLISSLMIDLVEPFQYHFHYFIELPPLTSSIIGGLLIGTGIGIMLRFRTSTGGTDLLAHFLSRLFSVNVGAIIFMIDGMIISAGGLLLSADTFFLSILSILAGGVATGFCTMGMNTAK
ncbi:YitT family protein [Ferviditalea candida]|uniref:YitT family protein n=1 Tax=Ferviditalea candida TaxID=3108399 RepID=A0ABU5ZHE8_9BACL|nr:YitT family protein [Paenibacillaceae bacterium T2]